MENFVEDATGESRASLGSAVVLLLTRSLWKLAAVSFWMYPRAVLTQILMSDEKRVHTTATCTDNDHGHLDCVFHDCTVSTSFRHSSCSAHLLWVPPLHHGFHLKARRRQNLLCLILTHTIQPDWCEPRKRCRSLADSLPLAAPCRWKLYQGCHRRVSSEPGERCRSLADSLPLEACCRRLLLDVSNSSFDPNPDE